MGHEFRASPRLTGRLDVAHTSPKPGRVQVVSPLDMILIGALTIDLVTPLLADYGMVPAQLRYLSHLAVLLLGGFAVVNMLVADRVPGVTLIVGSMTIVGVATALMQGQGLAATAWGWWVMFQFPLVALYFYAKRDWSPRFARLFRVGAVCILCFEVVVQLLQYFGGQTPGDHLAGTFGRNGTGVLVVFAFLSICLALGKWIASGEIKSVLVALICGMVASILGEMKIFAAVIIVVLVIALVLFLSRGRRIWQLLPISIVGGGLLFSFLTGYNAIVPGAKDVPLESYVLDQQVRSQYMGHLFQASGTTQSFSIGRNFALRYGWQSIQGDLATLLFGYGLGARGESRSLGTAGVGLQRGYLGLTTGTSLLVMMQELGLVGLVLIGGFVVWIVQVLLHDIHRWPDSPATELRYGLVLYSILWPLWLWYNTAWTLRVPMLIYWAAVGFVMLERKVNVGQEPAGNDTWIGTGRNTGHRAHYAR